MPRFVNTWTSQFEWHDDPRNIQHAIISHTWLSSEDGGEQLFKTVCDLEVILEGHLQNTQKLELASEGVTVPPLILSLPELCDKIQGICAVARDAGSRLVWIDSYCNHKLSSA